MRTASFLLLVLCLALFARAQTPQVQEEGFVKASCPQDKVCTPDPNVESSRHCRLFLSHLRFAVELNNFIDPPRFYGFCIRVDEFSQVSIVGAYDYMARNRNSTLRIHAGNYFSDQRNFWNVKNYTALNDANRRDAYASFYTAVIGLTKGTIQPFYDSKTNSTALPIVFEDSCDSSLPEDACYFEASAQCIRDRDGIQRDCAVIDDYSVEAAKKPIKIMVGFQGDDSVGSPLRSASFVPTRYRMYAWAKYYNSLTRVLIPKTNA
jgi:hypothetical protein